MYTSIQLIAKVDISHSTHFLMMGSCLLFFKRIGTRFFVRFYVEYYGFQDSPLSDLDSAYVLSELEAQPLAGHSFV